MFQNLIEFLKSNLIAFSSLVLSFVTLTITLRNHFETKPKLKVFQINSIASYLMKPDRISSDNPDVYWDTSYRVISEVVITNESSKPISIIEFRLNNKFPFNGYTQPGEFYKVTTKPSRIKASNGIVIDRVGESIGFPIDDWLSPILTIPPHTAIRGHLFFNVRSDKSDMTIGENDLTVITSRKTFHAKLEISQELYSQLPPEEQFVQDKYRK